MPERRDYSSITDMQARLNRMEQTWNERSRNQIKTIDRLLQNRQQVLNILNEPHSKICSEMVEKITEAINGDIPPVVARPNLAHLSAELKWHEDRIMVYDEKTQERFRAMRGILSGDGNVEST
jgi:hypothetical protein